MTAQLTLWIMRSRTVQALETKFQRRLSSSKTGKRFESKPREKTMSEQFKPFAIFSIGLYLGLFFFKDVNGKQPREGSEFFKELKNDFYRSSGLLPSSNVCTKIEKKAQ
mmetsp:Transcript_19429/g.29200  ORF Transcript_19429/g.29200 Transcript_19429/m.29200 type:complete len:109 (+) Transcript_19429:132-458(+)|eukprot:CAMPEP_0178925568 /NCGR_PEP_ID=MMETSP0786-20121207/17991_1 /TAXON_ID=186022 /ORGANISM="Thalassionema frauenfeldii, Strain CCMP 1798" /LENGTH=108 /DNA_ID=CAMNT_0020600477 /DNA_START=49 /DNA_END=375 /DNA_ORIENTATION=+